MVDNFFTVCAFNVVAELLFYLKVYWEKWFLSFKIYYVIILFTTFHFYIFKPKQPMMTISGLLSLTRSNTYLKGCISDYWSLKVLLMCLLLIYALSYCTNYFMLGITAFTLVYCHQITSNCDCTVISFMYFGFSQT